MKQGILYILLIFLLSSCFEEDEMVPPHQSGDLTEATVGMTENYKYQVYFDLATHTSVSENLVYDWDLGFETSDSGWHVILNTSRMMYAGNSLKTDFDSVSSTDGIEMKFDASNGNMDSTAIGDWYEISSGTPVSHDYVYVIDPGNLPSGSVKVMRKVSFDFQDEESYVLRFAQLDGSNEQTAVIPRDTTVNFVHFSFEQGIQNGEPPKTDWDLLFTQYSSMIPTTTGELYPYLVTGVLLNPYRVLAERDTVNLFDDISYEEVIDFPLVNTRDIIGYEWKDYDFDNGVYTVDFSRIYVIRDVEGFYYKLRFTGFYSQTGEKGFPVFEFVRL